ncbi:MAG: hypothetical protein VB088_06570 [Sphaerochaeta sp.]|nr:hypothetical protein [Sphaerochaeta sp.]
MKHHTILLIFLMVLVVGASALSASSFDRGIGAQAGQLSSAGLSFYQRLDSTRALQATVGLSLDSSYSITTDLDYGLGLEYQHTFFSASYQDWFASNLYWFIGLNHRGFASVDSSTGQYGYAPSFGIGGGFGVEPVFLGHFSVPISFGYGVFYAVDEVPFIERLTVTFLAQIGARYRF